MSSHETTTCPHTWCVLDHTDPRNQPADETDLTPHEALIGSAAIDRGAADRKRTAEKTLTLVAYDEPDGTVSGPYVAALGEPDNYLDLEQTEAMAALWAEAVARLRDARGETLAS